MKKLLAVLGLALACANAIAQAYTPTQAAFLKGEIKRAQERYVAEAASISGVPAGKIREWVATDGRDVPPRLNVLPALERQRGVPFSEEQRNRLIAADQARYDAIARAKREALAK